MKINFSGLIVKDFTSDCEVLHNMRIAGQPLFYKNIRSIVKNFTNGGTGLIVQFFTNDFLQRADCEIFHNRQPLAIVKFFTMNKTRIVLEQAFDCEIYHK